MAFDEVVWSPCLGTVGDQKYNMSGCTQLDASVDTGLPTRIEYGDASGFSSTPTIAQLKGSRGLNPVIGYYNRRAAQYNAAFGTSLSILSYVTTQTVYAADFTALFSAIQTLLTAEGWTTTLAWPNTTPTVGRPVTGDHLAYLRKVLAISGTCVCSFAPNHFSQYHRQDTPYGTPASETILNGQSVVRIGQITAFGTADRYRACFSWQIPGFATGGASAASMDLKLSTHSTQNPVWTLDCYSSNTDISTPSLTPAYGGSFYTAENNFEASFNAGSALQQSLSMTLANIYARANGYVGYMFVSSREFANTPAGASEDYVIPILGSGTLKLTLTF